MKRILLKMDVGGIVIDFRVASQDIDELKEHGANFIRPLISTIAFQFPQAIRYLRYIDDERELELNPIEFINNIIPI